MKRFLLLLTLLAIAPSSFTKAQPTFNELKIIAQLKQRLEKKEPEQGSTLLVVNHFNIPMIIGAYDKKEEKIVRAMAHINPQQAHKIPSNFFEKYINETTGEKVAIGCSYGNEIQSLRTSYFKPAWIGIVLSKQQVETLSELCKTSKALWITMILVGNNPIVFVNNPENNTVIHFAANETNNFLPNNWQENAGLYKLLWDKTS